MLNRSLLYSTITKLHHQNTREIRDVLDFASKSSEGANPAGTTILNSNDRKVNKATKNIKAKVINIIGEEEEKLHDTYQTTTKNRRKFLITEKYANKQQNGSTKECK